MDGLLIAWDCCQFLSNDVIDELCYPFWRFRQCLYYIRFQANVGTLSTEALFSMSEPDQPDVWGARIAETGKTKPNSWVFSHELNMEVLQGHCQGEPALSSDLVLLGRQLIGVIWPLQEISDGLSKE